MVAQKVSWAATIGPQENAALPRKFGSSRECMWLGACWNGFAIPMRLRGGPAADPASPGDEISDDSELLGAIPSLCVRGAAVAAPLDALALGGRERDMSMTDKLKRTILGAVIAIALAIAVSYGFISQQTADNLQTKANQTLSNEQTAPPSAPQPQAPPSTAPQNPGAPDPAPQSAQPVR